MNKTRITTILGTRPELIRLALIIDRLDNLFEHRLVHTGQNSDTNLSEVFFKEMRIRKPNLNLEISNKLNLDINIFYTENCSEGIFIK